MLTLLWPWNMVNVTESGINRSVLISTHEGAALMTCYMSPYSTKSQLVPHWEAQDLALLMFSCFSPLQQWRIKQIIWQAATNMIWVCAFWDSWHLIWPFQNSCRLLSTLTLTPKSPEIIITARKTPWKVQSGKVRHLSHVWCQRKLQCYSLCTTW